MNEVNLSSDLMRLAELYGISRSYWDAAGTLHHLSERTLRQLLVGFGVLESVDASEQIIGQTVHTERVSLWRAGLPPVAVLRQPGSAYVELIVPSNSVDDLWRWRVETESGEQLNGSFTPAHLDSTGNQYDVEGWANAHQTVIDDCELRRFALALPELPLGYHVLSIELDGAGTAQPSASLRTETRLIVAPVQCYLPAQTSDQQGATRVWGLALQLYAVRSSRNWGIGDLTDLRDAVVVAAQLGADVVGINPLHALLLHDPEQASPYSPSSRLFLNPLYIDAERVDGYAAKSVREDSDSVQPDDSRLEQLRAPEFVDYAAVAQTKITVLENLFDAFTRNHLSTDSERAQAFRRFQTEIGAPLQQYALFEALREVQSGSSPGEPSDWHQWPEQWRNPQSDAVARFAAENRHRIEFHCWLQWLAHEQLDDAAAEAKEQGMSIGLYRDLAVGVASEGSDTWANPALFADNVHVGAPPDQFSANGQDWALPPLNPKALRETGYRLFTDILRSNMRAAGALRIDHVMGLMRIFCIPAQQSPSQGTYVNYPIDDLLAIVALESQRQACIVIGEDLGTVPDGLRENLHAAGVLSYRLMYFEKYYDGDHSFRQPAAYPTQALVSANTHDLPTLRGFWKAADIKVRDSLGLFPGSHMMADQLDERARDRDRLLDALLDEALISQQAAHSYRDTGIIDDALVAAIHRFVARAHSRILMANLEDLLGQEEQINLPGTDRDLYPNWRRKLPLALQDWSTHAAMCQCAAAINEERKSHSPD